MTTWTCASGHVNDVRFRVCDYCGAERARHLAMAPAAEPPPQYREIPKREYARALPTDRCTEPGCDKTVAEHQAELRAALTRIGARSIVALGLSNRKGE